MLFFSYSPFSLVLVAVLIILVLAGAALIAQAGIYVDCLWGETYKQFNFASVWLLLSKLPSLLVYQFEQRSISFPKCVKDGNFFWVSLNCYQCGFGVMEEVLFQELDPDTKNI